MTTVERFGNLRLAIFRDHNPPHFHILGPGCTVSVDLRTFKVMEGRPLPAGTADVIAWARANADLLWQFWNELNG
jgi:hypothetical protein